MELTSAIVAVYRLPLLHSLNYLSLIIIRKISLEN